MAAEALNAEANALYMAGDKKAALEKYGQAIGVAPKVAKYHSNRAQVLLDLEKFGKAAADADTAMQLDPATAKHVFRAGQAYFGLGDYDAALARGHAMLRKDPSCANGASIVASCQREMAKQVDPTSAKGIRMAGERFLAAKDQVQGVYALPSGLRFQLLKRPTNPAAKSPREGDPCAVHYHGTLIDGTVFDSSVQRNKPSSFAPNQVIPGWTEALQLMREGEKWRVFLPSALAYGASGVGGGKIPGYSTLVFTIELLTVAGAGGKPGAEAQAALEKLVGKAYTELIETSE